MHSNRIFGFFSSVGMMLFGIFLLLGISFSLQKFTEARHPHSLVSDALASPSYATSLLPVAHDTSTYPGVITAQGAIVVDDKTNTILFSKGVDAVRPLASITKLMSVLVLADLPLDFSTTSQIIPSDMGGDTHVQVGERYTAEELWHVGLIASSNPAIHALVRASGLSQEEFVALMNKKAHQLRLESLKFVEPTGLDSGNVGTAADVAQLLRIALLNKKIYQTLQMPDYTAEPLDQKKRVLSSTDALLTHSVEHNFLMENIVGKTGYIQDAGYNFAVRLEDAEGHAVRIVLLGSATADSRFTEARDLAEWVFKHYTWPDQTKLY